MSTIERSDSYLRIIVKGDFMVSLKKLLLSAKAGNDKAFEEIVKKFQPLLINVSFRSGSFDEDCYQECLISLYKAIIKFEIR